MTSPRRPVNKASSRLRPTAGEATTRRRTARVTAGQGGTRPSTDEPTAKITRDGAPTSSFRRVASLSPFRRVFGRNPSGDPGRKRAGMADGPRAGMTEGRAGLPEGRAWVAGGPRSWGLAAGLLLAAVVVTAVAVVAALRPGVEDGNRAFVDTKATQEVTAAADNALKTIYSYDIKTIGGYKDSVHKVVTGKMLGDFDKFADTTVSAVQQAQSTATATPDPIGVTLLTSDRAELLVDLTVAATKNGVPQESASGPIVLRMQKINGHWLASEIADR